MRYFCYKFDDACVLKVVESMWRSKTLDKQRTFYMLIEVFFCFPSPLRWYLYALYVKDYYCNIAISYEMFSYHLYNRVIGSIPPSFQHLWIQLRLFHLNPGKWITITTGNRICQNKIDIWPIMLHLIPKLGKNWMIFPRKTKNID